MKRLILFLLLLCLAGCGSEAYTNRGIAYAQKSEYEKAITDFTEAIRLKPNSALAYNNRGNAYQKIGEKTKADADFAKAKGFLDKQ